MIYSEIRGCRVDTAEGGLLCPDTIDPLPLVQPRDETTSYKQRAQLVYPRRWRWGRPVQYSGVDFVSVLL